MPLTHKQSLTIHNRTGQTAGEKFQVVVAITRLERMWCEHWLERQGSGDLIRRGRVTVRGQYLERDLWGCVADALTRSLQLSNNAPSPCPPKPSELFQQRIGCRRGGGHAVVKGVTGALLQRTYLQRSHVFHGALNDKQF